MRRLAIAAVGALPAAAATRQLLERPARAPDLLRRTAEHTIAARDAGAVSHVAVWVRLTATRLGDLSLSLRAPDGSTVLLAQHRGAEPKNLGTGSGCGGRFAVFDDAEGAPLADVPAPFVDTPLKPEERLATLNGKEARGGWTLRVSADGTADSGTLHDRALGRGELSPRGTGYPVGKTYVANLRAFLRKAGYLG